MDKLLDTLPFALPFLILAVYAIASERDLRKSDQELENIKKRNEKW